VEDFQPSGNELVYLHHYYLVLMLGVRRSDDVVTQPSKKIILCQRNRIRLQYLIIGPVPSYPDLHLTAELILISNF